VLGSGRVFEAARDEGVGALVYASSVGAYSPGPKDRRVDESWPVRGIASSFYARHKATVEAMLDRHERMAPSMRVVRMRPGLIFRRAQASEARRFFLGPLVPSSMLAPGRLRALPSVPGLRFQAVHTNDVVQAYVRAVTTPVHGPFNLVAEPTLDVETIASAIGAGSFTVPSWAVRGVTWAAWRAHLQPTPPGWLDMGLSVPLLSARRARGELGWRPQCSSIDAVLELLDGIGDRAGAPTPPLDASAGGPFRVRELATGIGAADGVGR
jgi:nucleoside-diphosphate-sugar epimerase